MYDRGSEAPDTGRAGSQQGQGACCTKWGGVLGWEAGPRRGKTSGFALGQEGKGSGAELPLEGMMAQETPGEGQLQPAVTQQQEEQMSLPSHLHPRQWRGQKVWSPDVAETPGAPGWRLSHHCLSWANF